MTRKSWGQGGRTEQQDGSGYWTPWLSRTQLNLPADPRTEPRRACLHAVRHATFGCSLSPGTNVCAVANGGCQQLCLYRGGGQRACACAHGMLAEDGASCREYAGYLLYSERTILKSIHLSDERNLNAPVQPFEDPEHMKNVIALAFDYRAGTSPGTPNRIFFSDIHFGNIQQINDDGSGRTTIVESEPSPNPTNK